MFFNEWQLAYQIGERIERSTTTPEVKMRYNMYRKVKLASRWMRYLSGWQQLSPWNSANLKLGRWPDASVCCACPSVWWLPCITDAASGPMNCWCLHYFSQWDWPLLPPLPWRWIANAVTPEQLPPCCASGGIVSPLVGLGNILVSTGVTFVVCAICSLLCALWAMRKVPMKVAMCRIFR